MLAQLFINNIAVIERASIDLEKGFTVLTGETGAGKSIIIDAIHAVLGERTSKELVRTGTQSASVSALFTGLDEDILRLLDQLSIPREEDGSLLVQRDIRQGGRSSCKLNGAPATVSMLKQVGPRLVTIHGQHESYELLSPEVHMVYLDSFAGLESLLAEYQAAYHTLRETQRKLEALQTDEGEKARLSDLLHYQIDEIQSANVRVGEREELEAQREVIRNSEKIAGTLELLRGLLSGDEDSEGLLTGVEQASVEAERVASYLPELEEAAQKLREAGDLLEDVDAMLRGVGVDFDPALQEAIEERLDLLYKLGLKYGSSEEKILEFLEDCRSRLHQIEFSDEERERLRPNTRRKNIKLFCQGTLPAGARQHRPIHPPGEGRTGISKHAGHPPETEIQRVPLYAMGCDKLQFLVSANKGEPPKPMSKIASGGELSRIMLAIKTVLSGKDKVQTLIFDEVDTGISGAAANKVGKKLKQVSQNRQVLCITHLAQIAALADHHLLIEKHVEGERTFTHVQELDFEGRKREVARIIGGDQVTDLQLEMAEEMLKKG